MIKRVYYFIDELDKEWYNELLKFINLLNSESYEDIYNKHYKLWTYENKDDTTYRYWTNLELFLFSKFLKEKWIKDFKLLYNSEFFIFNEKLFLIQKWKIEEILLDNTAFYTLRTDFNHPFHEILELLLNKKLWVLNKPKLKPINSTSQEKNKFYGIIWLYENREKYLWDIIIPYWIQKNNYQLFLDFVNNNLTTKIVAKKDWFQCRSWISMIDIWLIDEELNINKLYNILKDHNISRYASYITPYYIFKREFRIYFIKKWSDIKIYSIKQKKLKIDTDKVFLWNTFRENMNFDWEVIEKNNWNNILNIIEYSYEMISLMWFETWTLEFWETDNWKIVFFEVNPMWSPMVFKWGDEKNIHEFYMDLFNLLTYNI